MRMFFSCILSITSQVTLVELLDLVSRKLPGLPIAIVCSSRDSLDDVILALSKLASLNVSFLVCEESCITALWHC